MGWPPSRRKFVSAHVGHALFAGLGVSINVIACNRLEIIVALPKGFAGAICGSGGHTCNERRCETSARLEIYSRSDFSRRAS